MKSKLLMLAAVAGLCLGGCATYTGTTADDSATIEGWGASYDYPRYDHPGAIPVYRTGSPNGQDMGAERPEFIFYR